LPERRLVPEAWPKAPEAGEEEVIEVTDALPEAA
jgi:hypothetical protein